MISTPGSAVTVPVQFDGRVDARAIVMCNGRNCLTTISLPLLDVSNTAVFLYL